MPEPLIHAIIQGGVFGPIVLWFMWRDGKERDRQISREMRQDEKIGELHGVVANLVRAACLEVLTRPNIVERTRAEVQELIDATGARKGK